MTMFWVISALLVLVAMVIFVVPMYKGKEQDEVASRDELNKAFFKDRMDELKEESSEGLVENKDELVVELQQSLLDDVPAGTEQKKTPVSTAMLIPGLIVLVGVSFGMYMKVGSLDKVQAWNDTVARLPELSQRLMDESNPLSDQEMDDLTLALRTRLHSEPNDATGWLLLGRIGMANRDAETAQDAMARAYRLDPSNPEVMLSYGQTLMMIGDPAQSERARLLLRSVLRVDHTNIRALSLLAFDAFEAGNFQQAINYWNMMKQVIGADDPRADMLDRSIARAQSQLERSNNTATSVSVTVELDPNVELPEQGLVIISVHSADGAPMPVAARRVPLSSFPISLTLDDNDSMIPERPMTSLQDMIIKARIDTDGNVTTRKGDWYGQSDIIPLGGSTNVVINTKY
ncbi:c-type cytochrome biogenesis protein CcmI [Photobacterium gaetbulicola]|uniref:Cytochrome c-type biogenesis protein n=2 Tax=Photobacterium gaetbulicola TaxID=1295392 RepID=A0A0C5WQS0_9GAMM|nr:c-type cytochrome biogenesis protein CcmI [Photobacterium gaetbulicola]AJR09523.1 cytochrome c-type biogenesis protein [Photobacterium gaetbulicola Gung47]KHT61557.1 cytochrome C heme lyase [Photobacterium gaetbulicola]PSU14318.1 c-type cytochrome biogenesis protein CcmI [Photobacterium gaetbulicola]